MAQQLRRRRTEKDLPKLEHGTVVRLRATNGDEEVVEVVQPPHGNGDPEMVQAKEAEEVLETFGGENVDY